jgi:hypothetical protein
MCVRGWLTNADPTTSLERSTGSLSGYASLSGSATSLLARLRDEWDLETRRSIRGSRVKADQRSLSESLRFYNRCQLNLAPEWHQTVTSIGSTKTGGVNRSHDGAHFVSAQKARFEG